MDIEIPYEPRPLQQELHRNVKRFNVIVCHRRFGKTHWAANEILEKALSCTKKDPQYAYIAPNYGQAKRVAWDIFKDYTKCFGEFRSVNEAELRIELNLGEDRRIRIVLLGAENQDSLRGLYLDGAVMDEYASMYPTVWDEVVYPALTDRQGWGCFIGTPAGANHFKDMYDLAGRPENQEDWYRVIYKASESGVIPKVELEGIKKTYRDKWETYLQEFECDFGAALVGAYYGKEMMKAREEQRVTRVPYDSGFKVFTSWDLGMDDCTAIWFLQWVGRELRAIDYIEDNGEPIDFYAKEILKKPYVYAEHFLPHDAAARSLQTGSTIQMRLRDLGLSNIRVMEKSNPVEMLSECRRLINMAMFDQDKCDKGIKCLENYERKYDTKLKAYSKTPLHNWASHGADAWRTFALAGAMSTQHIGSGSTWNNNLPDRCETDYDIFGV